MASKKLERMCITTDDADLKKAGYIVGSTLGEGSYAKVKSAYSEHLNKTIAIKIINRKKVPKDFQNKFLPRELSVLKMLKHPNIVEAYEVLPLGEKVYIVMEMAGHGDLLEYIKLRGALPEEKAKSMFLQLVDGIEYLHNLSVVHRDLKCENLLLDANNTIKISDFGFAKRFDADPSKTFCGSAAYAAPEILQGIPYEPTAYDIWSMGVILYIMVCGSMPYDDSNIKKMIKEQTERKVGFSKSKKISQTCKDLIHQMLECNVKKRIKISEIKQHEWLAAIVAKNAEKRGDSMDKGQASK